MPLELIIREGDGPDRLQLVAKEAAILGRREDNDVVLPFSFVSARHGRVFMRGGLLHVEDMGSTNGTLVNGVALEPMVPRLLGPDDLVEIDRLALRARWVEEKGPVARSVARPVARATVSPESLPGRGTSIAQGAPAGVWEIQAGALPAASASTLPIEARTLGPAPLPEPFIPARTLSRVPAVAGASRFRAWSIGLQLLGLIAVVGGLALLLVVLLA
jgi:hypothetical protein